MKKATHNVDLTPEEMQVIEAALHTQEKILSVQSRAGGDSTVGLRLSELKSVLANLQRQRGKPGAATGGWFFGRSLFG